MINNLSNVKSLFLVGSAGLEPEGEQILKRVAWFRFGTHPPLLLRRCREFCAWQTPSSLAGEGLFPGALSSVMGRLAPNCRNHCSPIGMKTKGLSARSTKSSFG
jgi:hypothetical protein